MCVCSCNQFVIDQWTLLNLHPSCCLEELVSYSRNLSSFYHLSHTYQPVTIADRPHSLHVAGNHRNTITVKPEIVCIDLNTSDFFISLSSKKGYHQFKSCLFFSQSPGDLEKLVQPSSGRSSPYLGLFFHTHAQILKLVLFSIDMFICLCRNQLAD